MKRQELIQRLEEKMNLKNYALDTVKAYRSVCNNFFSWLVENPECKNLEPSKRIEAYLTHRVMDDDISASTQNVEFNALIYLHREILGLEVHDVNSLRARPKIRIPPILSKDQVRVLISSLPSQYQLIAKILYGTGLRVNECLRLRIKDLDFNQCKVVVHEGKGDKERVVPMPESICAELRRQAKAAEEMWVIDISHRHGVHIPRGLEQKYKTVSFALEWYWLFPNSSISQDPRSKRMQRHHIYDFAVQKAFLDTRRKLNLPSYTTPHSLRHAFATHLTQDMLMKGFPREMIEAKLIEYMGHSSKETLKFYLHLAAPPDKMVVLPIEGMFP